ncbi:MAG: hypothetical protein A2Y15_08345 [Clostridiales bacterium GWF2_36_10]|nr:MAG: hypothetical protein A2Y15_08345 [Clostridiales bacterium GWF2_36_10]
MKRINCFNDFLAALLEAGFSMVGSNDEGIFSLCSQFGENIVWHTENPETDPWEWRMRVLNERNDIAYAKVFFNKSGYITKEWYPYFLAVRRNGEFFEDTYNNGILSNYAKRIYQLLEEHDSLPLHMLKQLGSISKEDKSKFDRALTELQMRMFITMCGSEQKTSIYGAEYGWFSTVFCRVENFFDADVFQKADSILPLDAYENIKEQIYKLNPNADIKKIMKFIKG